MTNIRRASLAAAVLAGLGAASMGGANLIAREYGDSAGPIPGYDRRSRMGNNRPEGPTRAEKKRKRKIARASRRYNLRAGY